MDYHETFIPMAKIKFVWTFPTIVVYDQYDIKQIDIFNALLHGDLSKKILYVITIKMFYAQAAFSHVSSQQK